MHYDPDAEFGIKKVVLRSISIYAGVTVLFIVVFYSFHHIGNQIPYDLAQQRFSETFPKEGAGNVPITGIDYKLDINTPYEYCEISGMVLASADDEGDPLTAALLLKQLRSESGFCPELKDFSSRSGAPPWAYAKLRYWWGSKALFAVALHHLSVLEFHMWVRFLTYCTYLLLAGACLLQGWRTLLVVAPRHRVRQFLFWHRIFHGRRCWHTLHMGDSGTGNSGASSPLGKFGIAGRNYFVLLLGWYRPISGCLMVIILFLWL